MKIIYCIGLFLFFLSATAQETTPFFQNYTKADYKGDNQNWNIAQGPSGSIFFANNTNLLEYNGDFWEKSQLPTKAVIRSVKVIDDTLYTGAYHEFGFWLHDKTNKLVYRSLSKSVGDNFENDEIWKIIPYQENIIFQSFAALYILNRNTKEVRKVKFPNISVVFAFLYQDHLYLTTQGNGIYRLKEKKLVFEAWSSALSDFVIQAMVPYKSGALIATRLHGIYYFENGKISKWLSPESKALKGLEINNLTCLANQICIGTINNGLWVLDEKKHVKYIFNKKNGLVNNTVLHQYVDRSNTLWLGLDDGLACLHLTMPIYNFTDKSGNLGTVYSISKTNTNHGLLLGSNHGIFRKKGDSLVFVKGSNGQVWDLRYLKNEKEVIVGHNNGTFSFKNGSYQKISRNSGGRDFVKLPTGKGYVQPNYGGLTFFEKDQRGQWKTRNSKEITIPISAIDFDKAGNLWVNSLHDGIFRYHFSEKKGFQIEKHYPKKNFNGLFKINGDVFLTRANTVYKYDAVNDTVMPDHILQKKLVPFQEASDIDDDFIVTRLDNNVTILNTKNGKKFKVSAAVSQNKLVQDFNFVKGIDRNIYFFLVDGFLKVSMDSLVLSEKQPVPEFASVTVNDSARAIAGHPKIKFKKNQVSFRLTYHQPAKLSRTSFWYQLKGYDQEKTWHESTSGKIGYENLPMGTYELKVKNSIENQEAPVVRYGFTILPPWYFSYWAWILYLMVALLLFYLVHYGNKRKYERRRKRFEREIAYENKLSLQREKMENEKRITEIEKEQLKSRLKSKSKELATYAAAIAKKEEILREIETEINASNLKQDHKKLYSKFMEIKERQSSSEKDWQLFERNFNEVHEDFFEKLQHEYPKLTASDLKLCAYLKMNLSSKEIAPLIGITYRSVELHRYRLRKKLSLKKNQNLVKFLLEFI